MAGLHILNDPVITDVGDHLLEVGEKGYPFGRVPLFEEPAEEVALTQDGKFLPHELGLLS